jgi:hypothetical protein
MYIIFSFRVDQVSMLRFYYCMYKMFQLVRVRSTVLSHDFNPSVSVLLINCMVSIGILCLELEDIVSN